MQPVLRPDGHFRASIHATLQWRTLLYALLLSLAVSLPRSGQAGAAAPLALSDFAHSALEIRSKAGRHWFKVYLAENTEQQMQGLMFIRALPADEGMLFPLQTPRIMNMWMKNTLIPLDMLFIDVHGKVVCVRERAEPESLALISCDKPVKAVLEIGGGQAGMRGIGVGDTVVHSAIH
jgi:hypothetical protein